MAVRCSIWCLDSQKWSGSEQLDKIFNIHDFSLKLDIQPYKNDFFFKMQHSMQGGLVLFCNGGFCHIKLNVLRIFFEVAYLVVSTTIIQYYCTVIIENVTPSGEHHFSIPLH